MSKPRDTENEIEKDRCYRLFQKLSTLLKNSLGFVVVNKLDRFMQFYLFKPFVYFHQLCGSVPGRVVVLPICHKISLTSKLST